jgi:hypothetical protein
MFTAPLPLTRDEGWEHALVLRRRGYTYRNIARVMGDYHGIFYAESYWRKTLLKKGAPIKHPQMARIQNLRRHAA